jgi:four helix bundle protein
MDLVVSTYALTAKLPPDERFGLSAQMRRAAISIPSNVAEGHAFRTTPRAYRRYVRIALGSFAELETHVELAMRLQLATEESLKAMREKLKRTGQLLHGLLRSLRAIKEDRD